MARQHTSPSCPEPDPLPGPVRTCIGCRTRAAKRELLRVTVGSDAHGHPVVTPDPRGTAPGRGAHLHPSTGCFELAVRRKAFARALRFSAAGGPGLSTTPVAEHLAEHQEQQPAADHDPAGPTDRNWSSSS